MLNFILKGLSDALLFSRILVIFSFFYLLHDCLLVRLFGDHRVSFLKSFNKNVDSTVELGQVVLHVFLLTSFALRLFVSVELIECFVIAFDISGVGQAWLLAFLSFVKGSLRVGIFLLHESLSSFKGTSFDIFGSLWEEFAEFLNHSFFNTHENDVRKDVILQT